MNIISIGGSDPSSGAGIQSDIKTFEILGANGFTVITAITSQNTINFSKVETISPKMIKAQLESIFSDFKINAIKIGMVYNSPTIKAIYSVLRSKSIPIVVDPVITASTGGVLLKKTSFLDFKKYLIPISYVITPNVAEAEKITGIKIKKKEDLEKGAKALQRMGAKNVVITGFHTDSKKIMDYVLENEKNYEITGKKFPIDNHGSGCNYSASLTVQLTMGKNLESSTKFAKKYVYNSIKNAKKIGKGISITYSKQTKDEQILRDAITHFSQIKNIHLLIPECQTNFVFSKKKCGSINDVLGIKGRIVKSGKEVLTAGNLELGGSKHVASAVVEMKKKFPSIRSGVNLKFDKQFLKKLKKMGLSVSKYDRKNEPKKIKAKEDSSVAWGIKNAIIGKKTTPDAIYHEGDFGKEPMILIFGESPKKVLEKIKISHNCNL